MPIFCQCVCGLELECLTAQAGRKVMCPKCRSDLTVPPRSTTHRPEAIPDLGIVIPTAEAGKVLSKVRRPAVARRRVNTGGGIAMGLLTVVAGYLALGMTQRYSPEMLIGMIAALTGIGIIAAIQGASD